MPVILADKPVNREFHGDTVTYFEPDNVEDLRNKINEGAKDYKEGKEYIKRLTIEKATDEVEEWMIKKGYIKNPMNAES